MSPAEAGLRRLLLWLVIGGSIGIIADLALSGHNQSALQLVPSALALLSSLAAAARLLRPGSLTRRALQGTALALVLGGVLGSFEHGEHNYEFEAEIRPSASTQAHLLAAAQGASPLLAPGALLLLGALCLGAIWRDPR